MRKYTKNLFFKRTVILLNDSNSDSVGLESAVLTLTYDTNITTNGSLVVTDLSGLADQVGEIAMCM